MTEMIQTNPLLQLKGNWQAQWPAALACWSRFVQLCEPRWCLTADQEQQEQLSGSFAMIRLVDHAVVISLRQVVEHGLQNFAVEILAHEIGHHVYCPADLTDNARVLARIRAGLPSRENSAPFIANLYTDLLINDRLQRSAAINIAGVYRTLAVASQSHLWTFYMRIYETLWTMRRGELTKGSINSRIDLDAQLGARLIRSYAKDWLEGSGRFAVLCLPYLLEDAGQNLESLRASWHDTKTAGKGGMPEGITEIDPAEHEGAIHPVEDPEISGVDAEEPRKGNETQSVNETIKSSRARDGGIKSVKTYRGPLEYSEVLRASGADFDESKVTARYYRERALPHLIRFPTRNAPQAVDPLPEGLEAWDIGSALEDVDWIGTVQASPLVIPGVTTRQRLFGQSPGVTRENIPIDLYLGVDCSGSMGNPAQRLSYPVLAGAIIALSALRAGARVMVALSGEPGRTITTDGFERNEGAVLRILTSYLGTGTSFGIHRLDETFDNGPAAVRAVHILIVSDNDIFSSLDSTAAGKLGWHVARDALKQARGGGTFVLELPTYLLNAEEARHVVTPGQERLLSEGWHVSVVSTMNELVDFARHFSQASYGQKPGPGKGVQHGA